ncbi:MULTISPECIES: patatin-like phospholipase family protein [Paraburkholderia]|uniref:Patatin-like phospholipase family protein n=1 Tax=Paraburkholderia podalyriae TaxID=1938811 RepID=A0ABR7Q0L5_9BURK|nr:patatin-like phospholipase family protein [Paraburkholderia podalyriae]MBC8752086.1 patatin-like phospholipase family protein [Paraburkholderia podalyriae]
MRSSRISLAFVVASLVLLGACATRPVNPPIVQYAPNHGNEFERLEHGRRNLQDLVILAFSGGGTRAAAFSYGVLEALRRIEIVSKSGDKTRLLDEVNVISGVSGGSFTALAYGLYGEKLFDIYEKGFLKRNIQGELIARILNPLNWPALSSKGWGRSELAAQLYDEILFNGATFEDLERANGPAIAVSATEISTGSRVVFIPLNFDVMCAELGPFRLSRAAAASAAVPVVLSPITINNYGGTCGYHEPEWIRLSTDTDNSQRPAERLRNRLQELRKLGDAQRDPYFHLVDGAFSDNLGLRGVLDFMEAFEALRAAGQPTPLDHVHRIIIFVVNSVSSPSNKWSMSENPPGILATLTTAAGVPINRYSSESVELLKDINARWKTMREFRDAFALTNGKGRRMARLANSPNANMYVIDVSFEALKDETERHYLNNLPTSLVLPDEAVDRLRAAAGKIILDSPDLQQMLKDAGAHLVDQSANTPSAAESAAK